MLRFATYFWDVESKIIYETIIRNSVNRKNNTLETKKNNDQPETSDRWYMPRASGSIA